MSRKRGNIIMTHKLIIGIVGLGYVGLPLAQLFINKGHKVYGIDSDQNKISLLKKNTSYLADFSNEQINELFTNDLFSVSTSYHYLSKVDAIIFCVPTPLNNLDEPDLQYVKGAIEAALPFLKKEQLLVLESSTYPGTTEEEIVPLVQGKGWEVGKDIFVAYSPERINPGQKVHKLEDIPKIVGGETKLCTNYAKEIYESVFNKVINVSSSKVAEVSKLVENAQRLINISFMNELAILCDKLDVNIWEVIEACSTKPFGFTPYFPGPGVGGHCIPVDPIYLSWKAKHHGVNLSFIQAAKKINDNMPAYIVEKVTKHLLKPINKNKILIIGVAYKKDVNDIRESSAIQIFKLLDDLGIDVTYHDPHVPELSLGSVQQESLVLTEENIKIQDCVLILTDHNSVDYQNIIDHSNLVIDTRNVTSRYNQLDNVILL